MIRNALIIISNFQPRISPVLYLYQRIKEYVKFYVGSIFIYNRKLKVENDRLSCWCSYIDLENNGWTTQWHQIESNQFYHVITFIWRKLRCNSFSIVFDKRREQFSAMERISYPNNAKFDIMNLTTRVTFRLSKMYKNTFRGYKRFMGM